MEDNTVVTKEVMDAVNSAPVVEETAQMAIQPVVPPTITVPMETKNFLGLTNRQMKDAGVVTAISFGSIALYKVCEKLVKAVPSAANKVKEIWAVAVKSDGKASEQASAPEQAPASQSAPAENPAPQQAK